jgi:PQQ-like domain
MGAVSVDQQPDELTPALPELSVGDQALRTYTNRMRRLGFWYAGTLAVIVIAVVAWVSVVMANSEIAHAKLHIASSPAPSIAAAAPSASPQLAWSTEDQLAIGQPVWGATVITFSTHTVSGRNARTGAATWTYTRSDLSICEVAQEQGQTVAVFDREGNCDEVNAFDSGTGKRAWARTLDSDGQPINGHPTYAVSQYTLLMTTPSRVQAISPTGDSSQGGLDRWNTAAPAGCTDVSSALGTNGVLIMQDCKDGKYLMLRDAYAGDKVDNNPNPKLQLWRVRVADDMVPTSADTLISAYDPASGRLVVYRGTDGKVAVQLGMRSNPGANTVPVANPLNSSELVWIDGNCYAIDTASNTLQWTLALSGPPTSTSTPAFAVKGDAVAEVDLQGGKVTASYPTRASATGSAVYPVGSGFVIGGSLAGGSGVAVFK